MNTYHCMHCGMDISGQDKPRHDAMCHRLPPPVELAQMFLDEETTRPTTMSKRLLGYQSPYFIDRLDHGLALLGHRPSMEISYGRINAARKEGDGMVKCPRCGLRYNHVNIHLVSCRESPTPEETAAMFMNEYMTTGDLNERLTGKRGKLSPFHRERLSEGLKRMGVADSAGVLSERHRRKKNRDKNRIKGCCTHCGIRLDVAPEGNGSVCGWCLNPMEEYSRAAPDLDATATYTVKASIRLHAAGRTVPVRETLLAANDDMATRGLKMRLRVKYGEEGKRWSLVDQPKVIPVDALFSPS